MPRITVAAFNALIAEELPLCALLGISAQSIGRGKAVLRMTWREDLARPGGTAAGPALMALADVAMYAAVLGALGRVPMAVTTNMNTYFLRPSPPGDVVCDAVVLKLGRRLAVIEARMRGGDDGLLVAQATGTYSIPPTGPPTGPPPEQGIIIPIS